MNKKALLIADDPYLLEKIINRLLFVMKDGLGYDNLPDSANELFETIDTDWFIEKVKKEQFEYLDNYCTENDIKIISPSVGVHKKKTLNAAHDAFNTYVKHIQNKNMEL